MAESVRYTVRHSSADKCWYVSESGIEIAEFATEARARKYCARANALVNA